MLVDVMVSKYYAYLSSKFSMKNISLDRTFRECLRLRVRNKTNADI